MVRHLSHFNQHPNAPLNVTGDETSDGGISLNWDAVPGAKSYLIHYGGPNESDPTQAIFMGYSETNSWTLANSDVPEHNVGDKLYFYVQTYNELGVSATDVEKAKYLHDGEFTGSAWSQVVEITTEHGS